jgi:hypothetical protein
MAAALRLIPHPQTSQPRERREILSQGAQILPSPSPNLAPSRALLAECERRVQLNGVNAYLPLSYFL